MSQSERLARMSFLLDSAQGGFSTKQIQEEFEVSRPTVMRDLGYMRDRLLSPIVYDAESHTYRLHEKKDQPAKQHIPGLWLSLREVYSLLVVINLGFTLLPGLMHFFGAPVRRVLKRTLEISRTRTYSLDKKIAIEIPGNDAFLQETWLRICEALVQDAPVVILEEQATQPKKYHLRRIVLTPQGWCLDVASADGNPQRRIKVSDVTAVEVSNEDH